MVTWRIEPPKGLNRPPNYAASKEREDELLAEFMDKLRYVVDSFARSRRYLAGYNDSLRRLKAVVANGRNSKNRSRRLHPLIELVINHHARKHALKRTGSPEVEITAADVGKAACDAVHALSIPRGAPPATNLQLHVEALMALIQQYSGKPVLNTSSDRIGENSIALADGVSKILLVLRKVDPSITEVKLANLVRKVRKKYAGKPMLFWELMPGYGASVGPDGELVLRSPNHIEEFQVSAPIYCT